MPPTEKDAAGCEGHELCEQIEPWQAPRSQCPQRLVPMPSTFVRSPVHESVDIQHLNRLCACQEALRAESGAEDAKIYSAIKYKYMVKGLFKGQLVSQGTIIEIGEEDFVEYRVLLKPSFF